MKIDKRLSEEFGMKLPPPTPAWRYYWLDRPWSLPRAVEWIIGHLIPTAVYILLLGIGATVEHFVQRGVWVWFFVWAAIPAFFIAALFVLVLVANTVDIPDDNYPGS